MIMTVIINYNDNNSNKYIAPEGVLVLEVLVHQTLLYVTFM